ncbi:hypothetical protein D3C72_891140 [compost metagenome]
MHPGPAVAGIDVEPGAIGRAGRRRVGLGHERIDQSHGPVDQQAGGPAVGVLEDLAARGGGRLRRDPGGGQGGAGGRDRVAVGTAQQDHPTGGGGVQIGGGQEALLGPTGLDPAAPDDDALRVGLGPVAEPRHRLDDRGRALQVQRHLAPADAVQMGVAVGEAGEEGGPLQVHHLQPLGRGRASGGADIGDAPVAHGHDLGGRLGLDASVDGPTSDQQVLGEGGGRGGGRQGGGQRDDLQGGADHGASSNVSAGSGSQGPPSSPGRRIARRPGKNSAIGAMRAAGAGAPWRSVAGWATLVG